GGILPVAFPGFNPGTLATGGSGATGTAGGETLPLSPPGSSLDNPILPDPGSAYVFNYNVTPGGLGNSSPLFFDPPVANGYVYQVISGPNFASVEVPRSDPGVAHATFTLTFGSTTELLVAGTTFFFTSVDPGGVSQFTITGDFGTGPGEIVR